MWYMKCLAQSLEYVVWVLHWRPIDPETSEASLKYVEIVLVYLCSYVDFPEKKEGPLLSSLPFKGFQTLAEAKKCSRHSVVDNCSNPRNCDTFLLLLFCSLMLLPAQLAVSLTHLSTDEQWELG